jgi:hypothetical protein
LKHASKLVFIDHPVFLLFFTNNFSQQESTPPEPGGETYIPQFQSVSLPDFRRSTQIHVIQFNIIGKCLIHGFGGGG